MAYKLDCNYDHIEGARLHMNVIMKCFALI